MAQKKKQASQQPMQDKDVKAQQHDAAKSKKKAEKAKKAAASKKGKDGKSAKPSLWNRFVAYIKNVRTEMQRVVWPTRKELISASLIVIGALVFFGVFIAIIDNIVIIPLDAISNLGS